MRQPPSPGGPAGAQPWQVDLDWLWGTPPGNDGSPATLRLDVVGPGAARAAAAWLGSLPGDEDGVRGRGGWRADSGGQPAVDGRPDEDDHAVLLLTSAGEDVADGLEDAADDAHAALAAVGGLTLRWTPLPRDSSR
ncbi:hypothetical protein ACSBQY_09670 [Micrococcus lylae]|uniref:hypothetical protein n=1 Tax=Micrococcus lylae TaxID=1273 RepID=UPI003EB929AC